MSDPSPSLFSRLVSDRAGHDTKSISLGCVLVPVVRFLRVGFG